MKKQLQALVRDEKGANLVEYIILVGVIALVTLGLFRAFGTQVGTVVGDQTTTVGQIETGP